MKVVRNAKWVCDWLECKLQRVVHFFMAFMALVFVAVVIALGAATFMVLRDLNPLKLLNTNELIVMNKYSFSKPTGT